MLELFPFQVEGANFLAARRHAFLGDKMGLGKTPQAIVGAEAAGARKIAVACPAIARINWQREIDRWSIYGLQAKIQSFDMLGMHKPLREEWAEFKPDVLVIDEAHYLKTPDTARTKALYGPHTRGDGLIQHAGACWRLSGTLAPNYAVEVYTHLRASFPQLLPGDGSYVDFLRKYALWEIDLRRGYKIMGTKNLGELRELLAPHLLRRLPEQVLPDMPEVMLGELPIPQDAAAGALRELRELEALAEVQELLSKMDDTEDPADVEPHIARYRRVCGLAKVPALVETIDEELTSGQYEKIVVFAQHREVIAGLVAGLNRHNPVKVWGGDSDKVRQQAVDVFQNKPQCRVFVGQLQAASTVITLTSASEILFAEQSWVPGDNEQAIYRLRRIGQKSRINARVSFLADSLDEAINRSVSRKVAGLLQLYGEQ